MIKVLKSKTSLSFHTPVQKRHSTVCSDDSRRRPFCDKPSPLDFVSFLPWVCMEWQVPEVIAVIRMAQEKFSLSERSSAKSKTSKGIKYKEDNETAAKKGFTSASNTVETRSSIAESIVPIKAYYNSHSQLTEIAIDNCVSALHRKVILAISLCIPFHSFLTKLVIRKNGLNHILLHEVSKLLPHSNITDICLDDTYVPEGNYYVLLDYASNLKYLSLNRCKINDNVCKEIALRINFGFPAEKSLVILDLGSNSITKIGAKYLGEMLRSNRHLLHLNLFGNKISDAGFCSLVKSLQAFPLTVEEIMDKRLRNLKYHRMKNKVYDIGLEEMACMQQQDKPASLPSDKGSSAKLRHAKLKKNKKRLSQLGEQTSQVDLAEQMTKEIVGQHNDPYDDNSIIMKNNYHYSEGNFKLCSLNVGFNNLEYLSIVRILEILSYQGLVDIRPPSTGLIRIVLEGNYFPNSCPELEQIDNYLKIASSRQTLLNAPHLTSSKNLSSFRTVKQRY